MNRTFLERVRCILFDANVPKILWKEAITMAIYLINRCLLVSLNFKTPEEMWFSKPFKYNHLSVFGCVAYAHVRQGKLEPRALKCIFLGIIVV